MSGLCDLLDLSDDERMALCQELGRMTRIVPLYPLATAEANPLPCADAVVGGPISEQGARNEQFNHARPLA